MKILVLYTLLAGAQRKTIDDHLFSFSRYIPDVEFHYCNALPGIPSYVTNIQYDAIILHYTLLAMRWDKKLWGSFVKGLAPLKKMGGIKIALPQDEYAETDSLCRLFKEYGITTVFTCAYPIDYYTLYPKEESGLTHYFTTLTGFVDEETLTKIESLLKKSPPRDIDIGYRARNPPFWLGHFGTYKGTLAEVFNAKKADTPLKLDISTDPKEVFLGEEWIHFILRCRTMIGCLGGASIADRDGSLREKVDAYVEKKPDASFEEVKALFFPTTDYSLHLFALSPRHFECAMAKTCQILLEGDYQGILEPNVHFIELKKDYSNLDEVLKKVEDRAYCEEIAERAYQKVILSGRYTYAAFAKSVIDHVKEQQEKKERVKRKESLLTPIVRGLLSLRRTLFPLHFFLFRIHRFCIIKLGFS